MASAAKVATAYIDLVARTEAFEKAIDNATRVTRKFSAQMRAEMMESKAAIAMLGEAIGVHIPRHLQTVINKLPGVSAAMNAAFVATPILLAGKIIFETGEKLVEFIKKNEEAARKNVAAGESSRSKLELLNVELELSNMKLGDQLAKLEHKPQNRAAEALIEMRVEAMKLQKILEDTNKEFQQLLEKQSAGWFAQMAGKAATGYEQTMIEEHLSWLQKAGTPAAKLDESKSFGRALQTRLAELTAMQDQKPSYLDANGETKYLKGADKNTTLMVRGPISYQPEIDAVKEMIARQQVERGFIEGSGEHGKLQGKVDTLEAAKANAEEAKSAAAKQMEEWHRQLTAMQAIRVMSLDQDADYWKKLADNPRNSAPARKSALAEANKMQAEAVKEAQKLMFEGWMSDAADQQKQKTEGDRITEIITAQWEAGQKATAESTALLQKAARETFEQTAADIQATERIAEAAIRLQEAHGQISRSAAAIALMQLHDKSNDQFQGALGEAQNNGAGVGLREIDRHKQEYSIQQIVDAQAVLDTTWKGMIDSVYEEVIKKADETQAQMREITLQFVNSMNSELAKGMTGHKMNFGQVFENTSQSLAKSGLEKAEGTGLQMLASTNFGKMLGLGDIGVGKMGSKGNPMWIRNADSSGVGAGVSGVASSVLSSFFGKGSSSTAGGSAVGGVAGSILSSLFSKNSSSAVGGKATGGVLGGLGSLLTHFATGGDVMAGVPFRGGELGEEAFVASVPGRVIPHNRLGGDTYHIDARGTDPALSQANFQRALAATHAQAVNDATRSMQERSRRTPR